MKTDPNTEHFTINDRCINMVGREGFALKMADTNIARFSRH